MTKGHVTLGGRPYLLKSVTSYRRYPVNQMAPKIGQGQSDYRDLTSWDAWVVHDWQEGIGREADADGVLYAEVDSRVPNQLILPPKLNLGDRPPDDVINDRSVSSQFAPDITSGTLEVGVDGLAAISINVDLSSSLYTPKAWFYMRCRSSVDVELWTMDGNGLPDELLQTGVIAPVGNDPSFRWYGATLTGEAYLQGVHCLVLRPQSDSCTVVLGSGYEVAGAPGVGGAYDGSDWTATTNYPLYRLDAWQPPYGPVAAMVNFDGATYAARGDQLFRYSEGLGRWEQVDNGSFAADITALEVWGDTLYIGLGDSENYATLDKLGVVDSADVPGRLFYGTGGYLWRAVGHNAYYMGEGDAWSDPIPCCPPHQAIRGFAALDGELFCTVDAGLVLIAPGDVAVASSQFGSADPDNGAGLISHQGTLYMVVHGQMMQASSGAMRNIWMERKDTLPGWVNGRVRTTAALVNWPIALVNADSQAGFDTVWAWQQVGWHFVAQLPQGLKGSCLYYDRPKQRLWIGTEDGSLFYVHVSDHLVNPYHDPNYPFQPFGWVETDWFGAGLLEADKDVESLYLRGRSITPELAIDVYWQDDSSNEEVALGDVDGVAFGEEGDFTLGQIDTYWAFLGTFDQERQEIRWPLGDNRPNTKEIRLGLLLRGGSIGATPKLEAWRLKFHMMTRDWWGWDIPIAISGNPRAPQQMLDGTLNPHDAAQQIEHLDSLTLQVSPFLLTDIDGKVYEVKVVNASFSPEKFELIDGRPIFDGTYTLQLEMMHRAAG